MRMSRLVQQIMPTVIALLFMGGSAQVFSQHAMHGMADMGEAAVMTMPANDAVMASAPDHVMLQFDEDITLVKLALKTPTGGLVDIGFRFDPKPGSDFMQMLPELEVIDFYTVEWAILNGRGELVKGHFYFSFGPDARPASYYLEQMDQPAHVMAPDYRLL